jgi:hypothetical protein
LPRVSLRASASGSPERRDFRALVLAELPLGAAPAGPGAAPGLRPLSLAIEEPAPPAPPGAATPGGRAPGPAATSALDERCLAATRARAIELALVEPGRARSLVARAGRAAWLPELRLRVERRFGRSESLDLLPESPPGAAPLGLDTANDIRYEARATWDLGRLVFDPEEIAASAQALRMADMRRDLESHIVRLFFERRRLDLEAPTAPGETAAAVRRALRGEEIEAELDALSGGAFSGCLGRKSSPYP